jgi:hypothetical protein
MKERIQGKDQDYDRINDIADTMQTEHNEIQRRNDDEV